MGPPLWVDDVGFDLRQHVQTRAVPAPGDQAALLKLCAQLNQPPLDRSRPLWELWVLSGLVDGRVGLLVRFHHVVADGIAALALLGALFDATPDAPAPAAQPWTPGPVPSGWELLADNLRRQRAGLAGAWSALRRPGVLLDRLWRLVRQVGRVAGRGWPSGCRSTAPSAAAAGCCWSAPTLAALRRSPTPTAARSTTWCWRR